MKGRKYVCAEEDICTLPGKPAHFETLHIQSPHFVQKYSFYRLTCILFLQHYCMLLLLSHKCAAHLNA